MPKLYILDTDACSFVIRNKPPEARQRMNSVPLDQQAISIVTYAELLYGVQRSSSAKVNRGVIENFMRHLGILDWNRAAAECYAELRTYLDAVVVTNNERHFRKVPGLVLENWLAEIPGS
jgi:tRNA(fMet)-specific endonuclease VapC